jgi:hypothetical protein
MPDICAKRKILSKYALIKCNACMFYFYPMANLEVNKNIQECGIYIIIKVHSIHKMSVIEWCPQVAK